MSDRSHIDAIDCQTAGILTGAACEEEARARRANTPFMMLRPRMSIDGNQWCALYGDNLQDGVAGFGKSPADAEADFNAAWYRKLL